MKFNIFNKITKICENKYIKLHSHLKREQMMSIHYTKEFIDTLEEIECSNCMNTFYVTSKLKHPLTEYSGKFLTCPYCSCKDSVQDYEEDEVTHEKLKVDIFSV